MLETYNLVIAMITLLVVLITAAVYLYPGSRIVTTVPGLKSSDPIRGNLADISKAGSFHEFLMKLHTEFGDIGSFWMGKKLSVSICSPQLFKEMNQVFDRPSEFFELFQPLLTKDSIQYANGVDGKHRRKMYDQCYNHQAIISYYEISQKVGGELAIKWEDTPKDQHIPLRDHMFSLSAKAISIGSFGSIFQDDLELDQLKANYHFCWLELERRLVDIPPADSSRQKNFDLGRSGMVALLKRAIENRRKTKVKEEHEILIDLIIKTAKSENQITADCMTYFVAGTHTTALCMTWAFYFIAANPDVQEKVHKELIEALGQENVTHENISTLKYLRQVLDETLRCSVLAPYAARYQTDETELGGHKLPPGTPVVFAVGVCGKNPEIFPEPAKFDPEHFSSENVKSRSPYAFRPFGFAGKRTCPGYKLAYLQATVTLAILLRRFKIRLAGDQVVIPQHGLITTPKEEIWITLEKRKMS